MIKKLLAFMLALAVWTSVAAASEIIVSGADKIALGDNYEADIEVTDGNTGFIIEIASGKLPFGLRLESGKKIVGYPAGIEQTKALIKATLSSGEIVEQEIEFRVLDDKFRLVYRELPVVKTGEAIEVKLQGQGGMPPYSGCEIQRVRTFTDGGAAKPGYAAPSKDEAPAWLSVSDDCTISAAPDSEAVVFMVISAKDADGATAKEFYALRSADDPETPGWLETKAREYNKDYQERFSPYGLTLEVDGNGAYQGYGDAAMWTGTYLAGAAYYYAVTGEEYARANLKKALDATTRLREITGVPGLIARAYENDEWKGNRDTPRIKDDPSQNRYEVKEGKYKGWRFMSTASRDQFTGVLWGNGTVLELFDETEIKAQAAENIITMAAHIWDNEMHIIDVDGKHTQHGVMSGYGIQDSEGGINYDPYETPVRVPNGFNCALVLNWFNMAAKAAPDEETYKTWRERYRNLVANKPNPEPGRSFERGYVTHLKKLYIYGEAYIEYWDTQWFNVNLLFNNYFHLVRFEDIDGLRDKYREVMEWMWEDKKEMKYGCENPKARRAGREKNPHFTWQYLAAQGDRDPDKIFEALSELMVFPNSPRAQFDLDENVKIRTVPDHDNWACEPIPVQYRKPSDFQWQRSPYAVFATWPTAENGKNYPGVDVVTPYWMGRYFGYIPAGI